MGDLDRDSYLRHRYGGSQRLVRWREERLVERLLSGLEGPLERGLDVPSGHGRFTARLQAACRQVVCVDNDRRHLVALRLAEAAPPPLLQLDLRTGLPFVDRAFDLVFCVRFLHHVRDAEWRERLLAELVRVSARYVLVSYYEAASLHNLQKTVQHTLRRRRGRKLSMISRRDLHAQLDGLGCEVLADPAVLAGFHAHRVLLARRR